MEVIVCDSMIEAQRLDEKDMHSAEFIVYYDADTNMYECLKNEHGSVSQAFLTSDDLVDFITEHS